jgi:hypothetical protein
MFGFGRNTAQGLYNLLKAQGPTQPDPFAQAQAAPAPAAPAPVTPAPAPVATPVATPDQSPSLNQTITQAMEQPSDAGVGQNPLVEPLPAGQLPQQAGLTQPTQPTQYGYQPQQTQTVLDTLRSGAQIQ